MPKTFLELVHRALVVLTLGNELRNKTPLMGCVRLHERSHMFAQRLESWQILAHWRTRNMAGYETINHNRNFAGPPPIDRGLTDTGHSGNSLNRQFLHRYPLAAIWVKEFHRCIKNRFMTCFATYCHEADPTPIRYDTVTFAAPPPTTSQKSFDECDVQHGLLMYNSIRHGLYRRVLTSFLVSFKGLQCLPNLSTDTRCRRP